LSCKQTHRCCLVSVAVSCSPRSSSTWYVPSHPQRGSLTFLDRATQETVEGSQLGALLWVRAKFVNFEFWRFIFPLLIPSRLKGGFLCTRIGQTYYVCTGSCGDDVCPTWRRRMGRLVWGVEGAFGVHRFNTLMARRHATTLRRHRRVTNHTRHGAGWFSHTQGSHPSCTRVCLPNTLVGCGRRAHLTKGARTESAIEEMHTSTRTRQSYSQCWPTAF
jgi:hypothetical protein